MYYVPAELNPTQTRLAATTWLGVEFLYAKIGHGKTYFVVEQRILPALREGRHVWTNIDFGLPLTVGTTDILTVEERAALVFSHYLNKDVRHLFHLVGPAFVRSHLRLVEGQETFDAIPHGSRVILDEVQNIFSINTYKTNPDDFFRLLCMCRHFDIDFIFVSQNPKLVDQRIVSTSTKILRIKNMGFLSSLFKRAYRLSFHQSLFDWDGYASEVHKFNPDIFKLFKSSDSLVKNSTQAIPSWVLIPLLGIGCWILFLVWKIPQTSFWGQRHKHQSVISAPLVVSEVPHRLIIPSPAGEAVVGGPSVNVLRALSYRDAVAPVRSTDTVRWECGPNQQLVDGPSGSVEALLGPLVDK